MSEWKRKEEEKRQRDIACLSSLGEGVGSCVGDRISIRRSNGRSRRSLSHLSLSFWLLRKKRKKERGRGSERKREKRRNAWLRCGGEQLTNDGRRVSLSIGLCLVGSFSSSHTECRSSTESCDLSLSLALSPFLSSSTKDTKERKKEKDFPRREKPSDSENENNGGHGGSVF